LKESTENSKKKLLLHVCCGPCSTAAYEEIEEMFDGEVTGFYYNPNISPEAEMEERLAEAERFVSEKYKGQVTTISGKYDYENWYSLVAPLKNTGEGGMRCWICYYIRLLETFKEAERRGYSHVSTTLSISPYKIFEWLTEIGNILAKNFKIEYISKRWNYGRSVEISKEFGLYRQNYCGCVFSMAEREERVNRKRKKKEK